MKSLVTYYSRTGDTKFVAERIALELGADIEEIVDLANRSGRLGFLKAGYSATRGKMTKIGETQKSPRDYDLIAVGTPVWNSRPSPAIRTYLHQIDLSGKKVAIFCTNEGSDKEKALARIKPLVSSGNYLGSLVVSKTIKNRDENEHKISIWCNSLKSP